MREYIWLFFLFQNIIGTSFYVSVSNGSDSNDGTISTPLQTIGHCASIVQAGDDCIIRSGRYHEQILLHNRRGRRDLPITFKSYLNEDVIIDGTVAINSTWHQYKKNIYQTRISDHIWQLFVNDEYMIPARFPNAFWYDKSVFDTQIAQGGGSKSSTYGIMVDNGVVGLAKSNINATGSVAIMNLGSWVTYQGLVVHHQKGTANFTYKPEFGSLPAKFAGHSKLPDGTEEYRYFLESKLELLDAPTEWYYDSSSHQLFLWTHDGNNPQETSVRGRVFDKAFHLLRTSYITFKGLTFFGCVFQAYDSDHITLDSINFLYSASSHRMLKSVEPPVSNHLYNHNKTALSFFVVRNCTFQFSDGPTLSYKGNDGIFENNLFQYNDYACVNSTERTKASGFWSEGQRDTFRRNTISFNGPSIGYQPSTGSTLVELNLFEGTHNLQHDGSHVQLGSKMQNGSVLTHNWSRNTSKNGMRFDAPEPELETLGGNGTMSFNVIWNTGPMMIKNDYQTIINNVVFNISSLWKACDMSINARYPTENTHSRFENNGAACMEDIKTKKVVGIRRNNIVGPVENQLRDPTNLDFRPKPGSEYAAQFIGPYRVNDSNYWIPGRQSHSASNPIPPHGASHVSIFADLIWLEGYQAISHRIFHGKQRNSVANACNNSSDKQCFEISLAVGNNIFFTHQYFVHQPDTIYFWRVDTLHSDHIINGKVWNYTTKK